MKRKQKLSFRIEFYLKLIYLYLCLLLFMVIVFFATKGIKWGIISSCIFVVTLIITIFVSHLTKKHITRYINDFAVQMSVVQKSFIDNLPLPYLLLDLNGSIRWHNKAFDALLGDSKLNNKNIHTIFKDLNVDQFPKDGSMFEKEVSLNDQYYVVKVDLIEVKSDKENSNTISVSHMYALSFYDITQIVRLKQDNMNQKTLITLMFIDNYEEVMQSIDEVRRPLLEAMIYKKLNDLAIKLEGVVRKLEKDKYICLFPYINLKILKNSKFDILDDIRSIQIGNQLPVTLSIGVGVHAQNLSQSMEYARAAIDLALGRGGDQAVIKNKDKYSFYGGKTKGVEKSTRVKARIKAYAFKELVGESDRVLIMGHKNADLDSFGAALGVFRGAKLLDRPAHIVINSSHSSVTQLYNRLLEEKDYEEDMFIDSIEAIGYTGEKTLLVVVDVNRPSIVECPELLELSKNIVVFDHHRTSVEYIKDSVISYVEPYASSTSEMVTEILQYMIEKIKLKAVEADALFAGIALDTKNFTVKTGVRTFEAAAFLRRHGADSARVRELFKNDMESYKAKTTTVRSSEIYKEHIAISVCPQDVENPILVTAQAADELLNILGVKASFVLCYYNDQIIISARSLGEINVQLVMEKLGGGGHLTVAGAQLHEESINNAISRVKLAIDQYLQKGE